MKKKYLALTLMLSLLCISKTYAACTDEQINEFKKIEDEYKVTYEFNKSTKDYTVTFYTAYPEKYAYVPDEAIVSKKFVDATENEFTFSEVPPGNYTIEIIGLIDKCDGVLKTITLKLPKYNAYSEDALCEGIEEFYLCQPTYEKEVDRETFESRVNTYKKSKEKQELEEVEGPEEENKITEYVQENLIQIIIVAIFIVLVIITTIITAKSIRKSRRLE